MSIFGKLWDRITDASKAAVGKDVSPKPTGTGAAAAPSGAPVTNAAPIGGGTTSASTAYAGTTSAAASTPVDVEAIMTDLEAKSGHKSNWRYSIVDLMSLLGMDNSLTDRKALAQELGYTGDMNDSATMNVWLHQKVMENLSQQGGQVAANLLNKPTA